MQDKPKRSRIGILVTLGVVFIVLLAVAVYGASQMKIQTIELAGDPARLEMNEKLFTGNLLFFPSAETAARIKKDNPLVRSMRIDKIFPGTLRITVFARQPIAVVEAGGAKFGIDSDGVVTGPVPDGTSLPSLSVGLPVVQPGTVIAESKIKASLLFLLRSKDLVQVYSITKDDEKSLRAKTDKADILFTQDGDIIATAETLQTLLTGFRMKGLLPKVIDLRFTKPVIQF